MTNAWDHLPNAKHIDALLASMKVYPSGWHAAWRRAPRHDDWKLAWNLTMETGRNKVWNSVRSAILHASIPEENYTAKFTVEFPLIALVVYDDCAYMLDSNPDEIDVLARLGCPKASLLWYACKAYENIK